MARLRKIEYGRRWLRIELQSIRETFLLRDLQHAKERFLGQFDGADLLHALLALLLLFEELALSGDVAAIALGDDVLAERLDRVGGDDLRADRGLDTDFVLLARDDFLEPFDHRPAAVVGELPVDDEGQGVHRIAV